MNHYELLGVSKDATIEQIERAYEAKIEGADPNSKDAFIAAYNLLRNPERKKSYDLRLNTLIVESNENSRSIDDILNPVFELKVADGVHKPTTENS